MSADYVCKHDGVLVGESRSGRLVHLDELMQDAPEHEIEVIPLEAYRKGLDQGETILAAAAEMLSHHATLHPHLGCPWAEALERSLRTG